MWYMGDDAQWIKLPTGVVGRLLARDLPDDELDEWVIAGHVVRFIELFKVSPTQTQLCDVTARGWDRVTSGIERMQRKGWIVARKVPYRRNAAGDYSAKWAYTIPDGSPLVELLRADGAKRRAWLPVPWAVSRSSSLMTVAAYAVLHEQMVIDKAIVTTPSDIARLLGCTRKTARQAMERAGAVLVDAHGRRRVYVMPTWARPGALRVTRLGRELVSLGANGQAQAEQLRRVELLLELAHVDVDRALERVLLSLEAAGVGRLDLPTVTRTLEEMHLQIVARDGSSFNRLCRSFAWRIRGTARAMSAASARRGRKAEVDRVMVALAAAVCSTCEGTRLMELPGREGVYTTCTDCYKPPG